ncbi:hypothetical protein KUCAC02_000717 [Chaenocephalus aceratus]|uniref:Uncharacterized protein n=1 Tax=Chaenocephalus aceratus TaxID=36190 RepID=A0ACB9W793_CHAAC|nr:hypothetical protein KUCAC02_000717 [Chaenocephalus aceratus]
MSAKEEESSGLVNVIAGVFHKGYETVASILGPPGSARAEVEHQPKAVSSIDLTDKTVTPSDESSTHFVDNTAAIQKIEDQIQDVPPQHNTEYLTSAEPYMLDSPSPPTSESDDGVSLDKGPQQTNMEGVSATSQQPSSNESLTARQKAKEKSSRPSEEKTDTELVCSKQTSSTPGPPKKDSNTAFQASSAKDIESITPSKSQIHVVPQQTTLSHYQKDTSSKRNKKLTSSKSGKIENDEKSVKPVQIEKRNGRNKADKTMLVTRLLIKATPHIDDGLHGANDKDDGDKDGELAEINSRKEMRDEELDFGFESVDVDTGCSQEERKRERSQLLLPPIKGRANDTSQRPADGAASVEGFSPSPSSTASRFVPSLHHFQPEKINYEMLDPYDIKINNKRLFMALQNLAYRG